MAAFGLHTLVSATAVPLQIAPDCIAFVTISVTDTGGGTELVYGPGSSLAPAPAILARNVGIGPGDCPALVADDATKPFVCGDVYHAFYVRDAADVHGGL